MNVVISHGRLGSDPELKTTSKGTEICNTSIATHRARERNGEVIEETDWHRCVLYGRSAANFASLLKKGASVVIHGRLQTRSWLAENETERRFITEVIVLRWEK